MALAGAVTDPFGVLCVLVATPGRLLDHLKHPDARLDKVEYRVLDEADSVGVSHQARPERRDAGGRTPESAQRRAERRTRGKDRTSIARPTPRPLICAAQGKSCDIVSQARDICLGIS